MSEYTGASNLKLMVMGYARHGKDTVCELIPLTYKSSSVAAAEVFLFDRLREKYGYKTPLECFEDRGNHRAEWHHLISEYNTPDKTRLAKQILAANDVYCGIRCREEFTQAKEQGLFDLAIWVDAGDRLPPEPVSSITVTADDADIILTNNGTLAELKLKIDRLISVLGVRKCA
jgi:hypothetical protein